MLIAISYTQSRCLCLGFCDFIFKYFIRIFSFQSIHHFKSNSFHRRPSWLAKLQKDHNTCNRIYWSKVTEIWISLKIILLRPKEVIPILFIYLISQINETQFILYAVFEDISHFEGSLFHNNWHSSFPKILKPIVAVSWAPYGPICESILVKRWKNLNHK